MRVSVSRLKLFKACRKAFFFRYVENLIPVEKPEALTVGTNYHELIEQLYKIGKLQCDEDNFTKEHAMAKAYEKYIYPKLAYTVSEKWYEKGIGDDVFVGRLDGIADDNVIIEHKTTGHDIEEYEYDLQWDEQVLAYMFLTGSRKAIFTICRKPTIRLKKNETEEEFFNRMVEWYDTDTESKIRMIELVRSDEEVEAFVTQAKCLCKEISKDCVFYPNTTYCNHWGRRCEYASICLNYDPNAQYVEFIKGEQYEIPKD